MGEATDRQRPEHLEAALLGARAELRAAVAEREQQPVAQWDAKVATLTLDLRRLATAHAAAR